MSNKTSVGSGGLGCLSVVGIIFVVLKLLGVQPVASWSWLWVLCPFWIGLAITLVIVILIIPLFLFILKIFS